MPNLPPPSNQRNKKSVSLVPPQYLCLSSADTPGLQPVCASALVHYAFYDALPLPQPSPSATFYDCPFHFWEEPHGMADACVSPHFGELFVGGLSQAINNGRKTTVTGQ